MEQVVEGEQASLASAQADCLCWQTPRGEEGARVCVCVWGGGRVPVIEGSLGRLHAVDTAMLTHTDSNTVLAPCAMRAWLLLTLPVALLLLLQT